MVQRTLYDTEHIAPGQTAHFNYDEHMIDEASSLVGRVDNEVVKLVRSKNHGFLPSYLLFS